MSPSNLPMIAVLALIVWRFVFTGLRRRLLVREIARSNNNALTS